MKAFQAVGEKFYTIQNNGQFKYNDYETLKMAVISGPRFKLRRNNHRYNIEIEVFAPNTGSHVIFGTDFSKEQALELSKHIQETYEV